MACVRFFFTCRCRTQPISLIKDVSFDRNVEHVLLVDFISARISEQAIAKATKDEKASDLISFYVIEMVF